MLRSILVLGAAAFIVTATVPLEPTYYRDIVPILQKRCYECHHQGGSAMPLTTYKSAKQWARPMREVVLSNRMPPGHSQTFIHRFQEQRKLTNEEIQTIVRWVDSGAKEGDPRESPPPPIVAQL